MYADQRAHDVTWMTAAERDAIRPASCPSPAHADELSGFGDCSVCGAVAPQAPVPARSAAETPGTIASVQAFGWGA